MLDSLLLNDPEFWEGITSNRVRGLLSEFGIVLPLKSATARRQAAA